MFDIFDNMLALSEVEWNGEKYLRLKTIANQGGVESVLAIRADSKLPADVVLIQLEKDSVQGKKGQIE